MWNFKLMSLYVENLHHNNNSFGRVHSYYSPFRVIESEAIGYLLRIHSNIWPPYLFDGKIESFYTSVLWRVPRETTIMPRLANKIIICIKAWKGTYRELQWIKKQSAYLHCGWTPIFSGGPKTHKMLKNFVKKGTLKSKCTDGIFINWCLTRSSTKTHVVRITAFSNASPLEIIIILKLCKHSIMIQWCIYITIELI